MAYGRRIAEAEQRMRDHDFGGRHYENMPKDRAHRINDASGAEHLALSGILCDLPAETPTDVLVQLNAAALLMDIMTGGENGIEADPKLKAGCKRVLQAITSAIRVLLEVPGTLPPDLPREEYAQWTALKWEGELPPVRIGAALVA